MSYSKEDVAASLQIIETVGQRATTLRGYEKGAPYFFLWGVIWIVGYSASDVYPRQAGAIWLALNLIGILVGIFMARSAQYDKAHGSRYLGIAVSAGIFVGATYFVMRPTSAQQLHAFPALLVAFLYVLMGIQKGARLTIAGTALAGLTILGFAFMHEHFALWMAAVGGTTLLLTGFWLRRV